MFVLWELGNSLESFIISCNNVEIVREVNGTLSVYNKG